MRDECNSAYLEAEALTSDPLGMVVVLYDILLKDLHSAVAALQIGDVDARSGAVRHALLVLEQLQGTLDMVRGGVVAENLDRFYNFTRAKLLEGQIKASAEIFEQQATFVASIREAWQQLRTEQKAQEALPDPLAVSHAGAWAGEVEQIRDWSA